MTAEPRALKHGRERHQAQRRRAAVKRVNAYQRWLKAGCHGRTPALPSNADYRIWRGKR